MAAFGDYRTIETSEGVLKAGEALEQHDLVYINTTPTPSTIDKTTGPTDAAIGIVLDEYSAGDDVAVKLVGTAPCRASEEVSVGDKLVPAADGEVAVDDGTASHVVIGVAETYASAAPALCEANLTAVKPVN